MSFNSQFQSKENKIREKKKAEEKLISFPYSIKKEPEKENHAMTLKTENESQKENHSMILKSSGLLVFSSLSKMENETLERMLRSDIKMNRNSQFSPANQKWKMKSKKENHTLNRNE